MVIIIYRVICMRVLGVVGGRRWYHCLVPDAIAGSCIGVEVLPLLQCKVMKNCV